MRPTLVVATANRQAFVDGHREAGRDDRLVIVDNRTAAFAWLHEHLQDGDIAILENDLPDLYERSAGVFWPASQKAGAMSDVQATNVRPTIAVLFGGRSLEHDVSVVKRPADSARHRSHAGSRRCRSTSTRYLRWWTGDDLWHNENFKDLADPTARGSSK